jgi:hypothetical protein
VGPSLADAPIGLPAPPPPIDDADRYPVIAPVNLDDVPPDAPKVAPGEKDPTDPSDAIASADAAHFKELRTSTCSRQLPRSARTWRSSILKNVFSCAIGLIVGGS